MINTYDVHIQWIDGTEKHYTNLSRVAVKHYIKYFEVRTIMYAGSAADWPYVSKITVKSLTSH